MIYRDVNEQDYANVLSLGGLFEAFTIEVPPAFPAANDSLIAEVWLTFRRFSSLSGDPDRNVEALERLFMTVVAGKFRAKALFLDTPDFVRGFTTAMLCAACTLIDLTETFLIFYWSQLLKTEQKSNVRYTKRATAAECSLRRIISDSDLLRCRLET